ncbi:hypothetical protein JOF42_000796 [Microbacterium phyllosphaerae]|uniref:Transposase n=1 Tax=Microbacterium phyllosphaerae TaxID=124798 RepID=A0ABS4WM72_9MICO|nr:hypothetical protein [Microbacterium phyllosphaerae]MBP2377301.1 hypothetical protein [Microbacterium phyllosphaerae]
MQLRSLADVLTALTTYAWEFASRLRSFDDEIRPVTKSKKRTIAGMRFRDSSNLTWARDETGILVTAAS